mgnify:CR=1 FL=1
MNRVIIYGNLGADAEFKSITGGETIMKMRVATQDKWTDKSGQVQERTEWHNVVCFGRQADAISKLEGTTKGSPVLVDGSLRTTNYEKDGQKHYATEIVAFRVQLCAQRTKSRDDGASRRPTANTDDDIPY